MKIRFGFVSNSSSSSFIVAFPRIPANVEDTIEMLFGEGWQSKHRDPTRDYAIAARVYSDIFFRSQTIGGQFPLSQLKQRWSSWSPIEHMPDELDFIIDQIQPLEIKASDIRKKIDKIYLEIESDARTEKIDKEYKKIHKLEDKIADAYIKEFKKLCKEMYLFEFDYADDRREGELEHGKIFSKFPYVQFSHH